MTHDVYICYAREDRITTVAVCERLENAGIKCWYAPRDLNPGGNWPAQITDAIRAARFMVLIFSEKANNSQQVLAEVSYAVDTGTILIPLRISKAAPTGVMQFYLAAVQMLYIQDGSLEEAVEKIKSMITPFLTIPVPQEEPVPEPEPAEKTAGGFKIKDGTLLGYYGLKRKVVIPEGVTKIGREAFRWKDITSVQIPEGVTEIAGLAFEYCQKLKSVHLPDSLKSIGVRAFMNCDSLVSINIPDSVTEIGAIAFEDCTSLISVHIPSGLTEIKKSTFNRCKSLTSLHVPDSVKRIEPNAFNECERMSTIIIPGSVEEIGDYAFTFCRNATFICPEDSYAHQYCLVHQKTFIFDYQYEVFHGVLPPGIEKLSSPFLADEEKPYVFISYSHKDRDTVLGIIKELYESGWKIWYDEGLTIGDAYDKTLEAHVKNCSAFLLFVTHNSINSMYCRVNEIPWAIQARRPIIKCILEKGLNFEIREDVSAATVSAAEIEPALEKIGGLEKGGKRIARGISVVVNPEDRDEEMNGEGFAYCLYAKKNKAAARAIMLEAKEGGCNLYDAVTDGEDEKKLQNCACLVVFLDKAFLSDRHLTKVLIEAWQTGRDIAVCQLEEITDDDLPPELVNLHLMQWLNFIHGISGDMNTKLARHLQKRGCRNTAVLPGFKYDKTDRGIVIKSYTGKNPNPRIESEYGGFPVVEIANAAFGDLNYLQSIVIPDSVSEIGDFLFQNCVSLSSVVIGTGIKKISAYAFTHCYGLTSLVIPDGVTTIEEFAFCRCKGLVSVVIPDSVIRIGEAAFTECISLKSVVIPKGVTVIAERLFDGCTGLVSVVIPEGMKRIEHGAFEGCTNLRSVIIPDGVEFIGGQAFDGCKNLTSVIVPESVTEIRFDNAFADCRKLTVTCSKNSYTWKYCMENNIRIHENGSGFFHRLFGKK